MRSAEPNGRVGWSARPHGASSDRSALQLVHNYFGQLIDFRLANSSGPCGPPRVSLITPFRRHVPDVLNSRFSRGSTS